MMHRLHGVMCNEDELCWREHLEHLEHLECSGVGNLTSRAMSFLHQSVSPPHSACCIISQSSSCTTGNCRKDFIATWLCVWVSTCMSVSVFGILMVRKFFAREFGRKILAFLLPAEGASKPTHAYIVTILTVV